MAQIRRIAHWSVTKNQTKITRSILPTTDVDRYVARQALQSTGRRGPAGKRIERNHFPSKRVSQRPHLSASGRWENALLAKYQHCRTRAGSDRYAAGGSAWLRVGCGR